MLRTSELTTTFHYVKQPLILILSCVVINIVCVQTVQLVDSNNFNYIAWVQCHYFTDLDPHSDPSQQLLNF